MLNGGYFFQGHEFCRRLRRLVNAYNETDKFADLITKTISEFYKTYPYELCKICKKDASIWKMCNLNIASLRKFWSQQSNTPTTEHNLFDAIMAKHGFIRTPIEEESHTATI